MTLANIAHKCEPYKYTKPFLFKAFLFKVEDLFFSSFCLYAQVTNWATYKMKPRITILPSLRLGGHNNPNPYPLRLPRLSGESNALRRGFYPIPRPFPSPGEGMQPLASARSVTKVSATHQRIAGRFLTQQSCDCFMFAPLTSIRKTIQLWFLLRLLVFAPLT